MIDGGSGNDTVDFSGSTAGVSVDLRVALKPVPGLGGYAQGDLISGVENVVGSDFADMLIGDEGDNRLDGGAGDDLLNGGGGGTGSSSHQGLAMTGSRTSMPNPRAARISWISRPSGSPPTTSGIS